MTVDTKIVRGTPIVWDDSAGDLVMTLQNLAAGAGRIGARKDLGAGATDELFEVRITVQFETQPVVGETIDVYVSTSDGTEEDGQAGSADAAVAEGLLVNMKPIGSLSVPVATVDIDMTTSFVARILTRYFSPVIFNNTVDNLQDTANTCEITFTPITYQAQDAV